MVVQAACRIIIDRVRDIQVIPLHRHGDIGKILAAFGFLPGNGYTILEQGFIDEHGNFLNRREAWKQAVTAGQIQHETNTAKMPELFSEDLY